jgi:sugar lactone lactonase YvrE
MLCKRKTTQGLFSTLGLALATMLVFGAFAAGAAQASSIWQIEGKSFGENLITSETFSSEGTFEMEFTSLKFSIACSETGYGALTPTDGIEETLTLSNCHIVNGGSGCEVQPIKIPALTGTAASQSPSPNSYILNITGAECGFILSGETIITSTVFTPTYSAEATKLTVTRGGSSTYGSQPIKYSGSSTWQLSGSNKGKKFGLGSHGLYFSSAYGSLGSEKGQLREPTGVVVDGSGNRFILDTNNNRVEKFSSSGAYVSQFGTVGSGNGQLRAPRGIAIDGSGNIWVADTENNRVEKFSSSGAYVSQFGTVGSGNGQLSAPRGIAISGTTVYVADTGNNRIETFDTSGTYLSQFGTVGSGNGQLSQPSAVVRDTQSSGVYVVDTGNNRIEKFNSSGAYLSQFGTKGAANGQFSGPKGIAVEAKGNVWITDAGNNRVEKFNSSGEYLTKFGGTGSGNGQFLSPTGIVVGTSGNITVTDTLNNRVQEWATL